MSQVSKPTSVLDIEVQCKDFMRWLEIEEHEGYAVLKQREYIDRKTWLKIYGLVKDMGGRYLAGLSAFEVPFAKKPTIKETPSSPKKPIKEAYEEREQLFAPPEKPTVTPISLQIEQKQELAKKSMELVPEPDEYDSEHLQILERSKRQEGYLETVKKDQYGNILSGRHRKKVDPKWPEEVVEVKDELDRELKIIHFNVQRRPRREETARRLVRIAQLLESRGVPKPDICPAISNLVPYTERHVRRLLPDEYKHVEFRAKEPKPLPKGEIDLSKTSSSPSKSEVVEAPESEGKDTGLVFECPICGFTATHIHHAPNRHTLQKVTITETKT